MIYNILSFYQFQKIIENNYIHNRVNRMTKYIEMMVIADNVTSNSGYGTIDKFVVVRVGFYHMELIIWCNKLHKRAVDYGLYDILCKPKSK